MAGEFSDAARAYIDAQIQLGINVSNTAGTKAVIDGAIAAHAAENNEKVKSDMLKIDQTLIKIDGHMLEMKNYVDQMSTGTAAFETKLKEGDAKLKDGLEDLRQKGATFGVTNQETLGGLEVKLNEQKEAIVKMYEERDSTTNKLIESVKIQQQGVEKAMAECASAKTDIGQYVMKKESDMKEYMDAKETHLQDILVKKEQELNSVAAALQSSMVRDSGARGFNNDGSKRSGLVDVKETGVGKLPVNVAAGEFITWRSNLDLHVENFEGFKGFGELLKLIRLEEDEMTFDQVVQLAHDVGDKEEKKGRPRSFDGSFGHVDVFQRADELYKYIFPKLNLSLTAAASRVPKKHGFELYRVISQKMDSANKATPMQLIKVVRTLSSDRCKNLTDTKVMLDRLDKIKDEFVEKVGREIDQTELMTVIWTTMDEKSHDKAVAANMSLWVTKYDDLAKLLRDHMKSREELDAVRAVVKPGFDKDGDVKMYNVNPGQQQPQQQPQEPSDWSRSEPPPEPYVDDWEDYDYGEGNEWIGNLLGALKGKGGQKGAQRDRGKGSTERPRLVCRKCGGFDHPERLCPNVEGCNHKCTKCGGTGHFESNCIAKSREERMKEKGNPKGGGGGYSKGGGGKGSNFYGGKGQKRGAYALGQAAPTLPNGQTQFAPPAAPPSSLAVDSKGQPRVLGMFGRKMCDGDGIVHQVGGVRTYCDGYNSAIRWKTATGKQIPNAKPVVSGAKFFIDEASDVDSEDEMDSTASAMEPAQAMEENLGLVPATDMVPATNKIIAPIIAPIVDGKVSGESSARSTLASASFGGSGGHAGRDPDCSTSCSTSASADFGNGFGSSTEKWPTCETSSKSSNGQKKRRRAKEERDRANLGTQDPEMRCAPISDENAGCQQWIESSRNPGTYFLMQPGEDEPDGDDDDEMDFLRMCKGREHLLFKGGMDLSECPQGTLVPKTRWCSGGGGSGPPPDVGRSAVGGSDPPLSVQLTSSDGVRSVVGGSDPPLSSQFPNAFGSIGNGHTSTDDDCPPAEHSQDAQWQLAKSKPTCKCTEHQCGSTAEARTRWEKQQFRERMFHASNFMAPLTFAHKQLSAVGPAEWTAIKVIVDSGACETVMPRNMLAHIQIRPSAQSRAKIEYEVASGSTIPCLGERNCEMYAEGCTRSLLINFQVADVHRPLLSLSRAADMGYRSYLEKDGGWLEDTETGEWLPIQREGDLYVMTMHVRAAPANSAADQAAAAGTAGNNAEGFARRG